MRCEKGNYFFVLTSYYCKYFLFGFDSIGFFFNIVLNFGAPAIHSCWFCSVYPEGGYCCSHMDKLLLSKLGFMEFYNRTIPPTSIDMLIVIHI